VVPNVSIDQLASSSPNNRGINILSNNDTIQSVHHTKLNIVQAAFYRAGKLTVTPNFMLTMDSQGMAMVKLQGDRIKELSLSDPSRQLRRISITVPGIYTTKQEGLICLPNQQLNNTMMIVDVPQGVNAGKSVAVSF
jgi:chondroitin AC lyase